MEEEEEMRRIEKDRVYLVVEFTCVPGNPASGRWMVRLCNGGPRVALSSDPDMRQLSSELRYPMQAESRFLIRAVQDLMQRVFKKSGVSGSVVCCGVST